jgi:HrpA-like RNA helicase
VSATSLAERVSEEWGCGQTGLVSGTVGYRAGAMRKSCRRTDIEYVTEGTFLASLLQLFGGGAGARTGGGGGAGAKARAGPVVEEPEPPRGVGAYLSSWIFGGGPGADAVAAAAAAAAAVAGTGTEAGAGAGAGGEARDPLQGVGAIIVDEAHERSVTCDLILGILRTHAPTRWRDIKVIVTSATLDADLFSEYFHRAPVLRIPGRMFPVDVQYLAGPDLGTQRYVEAVVKTAIEIHQNTSTGSGDILCFLTGQDEVDRARQQFEALSLRFKCAPCVSLSLYGKQLPEEQRLVFVRPPKGTRKVVFATDVAETGVTIDGIRHIVDSGLCKESSYDSKRNVTVLAVKTICKSSAEQRKGRAGRTSPGTCYRLYSADEFDAMPASRAAEVLSRPLPLTAVTLVSMGIDPRAFQWVEAPDGSALDKALDELRYLEAIRRGPDGRWEHDSYHAIML